MATQALRQPRGVYTLRLAEDERELLEAAAIRAGAKLSTYIRRAATDAARRQLLEGEQ